MEKSQEEANLFVVMEYMCSINRFKERIIALVLHSLCDGKTDYNYLKKLLESARKTEIEATVRLQNYLEPFLKVDCVLRDYLINGHLLNAVHELERLHAIATTGKDPDVIEEPIVYCENCEVKPVKRIRNS